MANNLEAVARVNFVEGEGGETTLKVKVLSTKFGTIHYGRRNEENVGPEVRTSERLG